MKTAYSYLRFSTPDQQLGDSERRQLNRAKLWCERHKLTLSNQCFADRGVSAFHGKHRDGALGRLLQTVKPGEVILIEECDRWSRERAIKAISQREAASLKATMVIETGSLKANANSTSGRSQVSM